MGLRFLLPRQDDESPLHAAIYRLEQEQYRYHIELPILLPEGYACYRPRQECVILQFQLLLDSGPRILDYLEELYLHYQTL